MVESQAKSKIITDDRSLSLCSLLYFASFEKKGFPCGIPLKISSLFSTCYDKAIETELFTNDIGSEANNNHVIFSRTLFQCLKTERTAEQVAVALLSRGRLEGIIEESKILREYYCRCQVLTSTSIFEQLYASIALSVVCLTLKFHDDSSEESTIAKLSDVSSLSVGEMVSIGRFIANLLRQRQEGGDLCMEYPGPPRRVLIGHVLLDGVKFDIVIERDKNVNSSGVSGCADSDKSAWTTPGFRLLFTQDNNTVAYILVEVGVPTRDAQPHPKSDDESRGATSAPTQLEWLFRGMRVNSDMRGKGFSKMALMLWLLLCQKMGAVASTKRINKPLISLALMQIGFEVTNIDTAVAVELQSSKKRTRNEGDEDERATKKVDHQLEAGPTDNMHHMSGVEGRDHQPTLNSSSSATTTATLITTTIGAAIGVGAAPAIGSSTSAGEISTEGQSLSKNEQKKRLKAQKFAEKKSKKKAARQASQEMPQSPSSSHQSLSKKGGGGDVLYSLAPLISIWCSNPRKVISILSKSEMMKFNIELLQEKPRESRTVYVNAAYHLPSHIDVPKLLSSYLSPSSSFSSSSSSSSSSQQPVIDFTLFSAKLLFAVHPSLFSVSSSI